LCNNYAGYAQIIMVGIFAKGRYGLFGTEHVGVQVKLR